MATNTGYDYATKQGDSGIVWTDTLSYSDGTAANLTGATVQFVMRSQTSGTATTATATVTNAAAGQVSYTPTAAATAVAGLYQASWVVTFGGGQVQTWPTDGYLDVWIEPNLTSDTSQQLVSLFDVKDHLNIPAADRTRDQKLWRWITAATPVIEAITGPIIVRSHDEWYDGGGLAVALRYRPLVTLEAVSIYLGPVEYPMSIVTQPQAGSVFSVMADTNNRIVRRGPGGSLIPFPAGAQTVHVVYTAGFTAIPENVRMGTLELIRENWVDTQTPGWGRGAGLDRDTEQPAGFAPNYLVSDLVREWLAPNRRRPSVV